jgi:MEMO1 family protein
MNAGIKTPNVSGTFYPSNSDELRSFVMETLESAKKNYTFPKALIAPHAGYIFSGEVAASAYKSILNSSDKIKQVVLLSPTHHYSMDSMALHSADCFNTPLGNIEVDNDLKNKALTLNGVSIIDEAFEKEHALEVHLPFIQICAPNAKVLPIIVGQVSTETVANLLNSLWDGEETIFIISSDLSHFNDYDQANMKDEHTKQTIEDKNVSDLKHEDACGFYPIRGLLQIANEKKLEISCIDLRNSGDTAGNKSSVVGYGAFLIH